MCYGWEKLSFVAKYHENVLDNEPRKDHFFPNINDLNLLLKSFRLHFSESIH